MQQLDGDSDFVVRFGRGQQNGLMRDRSRGVPTHWDLHHDAGAAPCSESTIGMPAEVV